MPASGVGAPDDRGSRAAPTTHREVERKFRVGAGFELPQLAGVVTGVAQMHVREPVTMLAHYHDTADLRLIRWGATLRRRVGGPDEGWHLKLPVDGAGAGVRDEIALPLDEGETGHVPDGLADIVVALAREAPLVHVSTVRTHRTPYVLLDESGRSVAELVDDRVAVLEDGAVVRAFREIEIEARSDGPGAAVLDAVGARLAAHDAEPGTEGKAAAALGPRAQGLPDVVVPPWPRPRDPAGDTVRCVLAENARKLLLEDVRVRRGLPDSVHQLRVAARRLRSALRTFAPLLETEWATELSEELSASADALGVARDTEVHLARLEKHAEALPVQEREPAVRAIEGWLRGRLADATAAALAELRGERHRQLLVDIVAAAREPRLTATADAPARDVLPRLVTRAAGRLTRAVERLSVDGPAAQWHRARILAKRARYAAEAVAPVLGARSGDWAEALERVTDLLGDHQDACTAQVMLRELAARPDVDGTTGFALGILDGVELERERADRAAFMALWPEVRAVLRKRLVR